MDIKQKDGDLLEHRYSGCWVMETLEHKKSSTLNDGLELSDRLRYLCNKFDIDCPGDYKIYAVLEDFSLELVMTMNKRFTLLDKYNFTDINDKYVAYELDEIQDILNTLSRRIYTWEYKQDSKIAINKWLSKSRDKPGSWRNSVLSIVDGCGHNPWVLRNRSYE